VPFPVWSLVLDFFNQVPNCLFQNGPWLKISLMQPLIDSKTLIFLYLKSFLNQHFPRR